MKLAVTCEILHDGRHRTALAWCRRN